MFLINVLIKIDLHKIIFLLVPLSDKHTVIAHISASCIYSLNSIIMKSLKEFITENLENSTVPTVRENILKGQTNTAKTESE